MSKHTHSRCSYPLYICSRISKDRQESLKYKNLHFDVIVTSYRDVMMALFLNAYLDKDAGQFLDRLNKI